MLTVFSLINSRVYPLNIDRYHINIAVNNQVVNTKINQTFTNPNDSRVNGLYIFPVTDDVERSNFILSIDGSPVTGELLSNEESRMYYESIVQEGYIGLFSFIDIHFIKLTVSKGFDAYSFILSAIRVMP